MDGELHVIDGRSVLRFERRLAHPPEKVWRAITEPAHFNQWYPFAVKELELRVSGAIRFDGGAGTALEGVITELDPPLVFAFRVNTGAALAREGDNILRFELRPDGAACLLIFTHTFDDRAAAASYASGWQVCLDALELVVAGEPVTWPSPSPEQHEAYVAAFGLAEGSAEAGAEGWRVRFERQLTRPIERVWATLTGRAPATAGGPPPRGFTAEQFPPGPITAVRPPALLEYEWRFEDRPAGRVRWELSEGTGHGARLTLTQTGPRELAGAQEVALAAWKRRIEELVGQLKEEPGAPPPEPLGTLSETKDGRIALRFERRLAHPPEKVWRAITEEEHLRAWFPAIVHFDLTPGAALRFAATDEQIARFGMEEGAVTEGVVTHADPPRLLEYTWDGEILRWELSAEGGGCLLAFTHILDDRDLAPAVGAGWHAGLEIVAAQLDGRPIDWSIWERAEQLTGDYRRSFG